MKKVVLLLLGIAIGVGISYFYFNKQETSTTIAIIKPKGVITPAQAKALNKNWTDKRKKAVDSAAGRPDNRSSWWSLKDIQDYLVYAENQADTLGYNLDGIRIYQGVYGGKAPNGKADYSTIFWVPTGKKSKSEGNMLNFALQRNGNIPGADPFNGSDPGVPPDSGY